MTPLPPKRVLSLYAVVLGVLIAMGGAGAAAGDLETQTFYLEWSPTGFEHPFWFDVRPDVEIQFRDEPEYAGSSVMHTALFFGDGPDDFVGLANIENELLYIDANRNLDLTDDPGPFRGYSQFPAGIVFENVHIELEQEGIAIPYNLSMHIYVLDSIDRITVRSFVRSGWKGRVELGNETFRMAVIGTPDSTIGLDTPFIIEPDDAPTFERYSPLPAPAMLMFDDQYWELSLALAAPLDHDEPPLVQADLTRADPPMGTLSIDGMHVTGIVVDGPVRVSVDDDIHAIRLPVGAYRIIGVVLEEGWYFRQDCQCCPPQVLVSADEETRIQLGGPVREVITATVRGRYIRLSYTSKGADGLEYEKASRSGPPRFVITKDDKEIAAGTFEYG